LKNAIAMVGYELKTVNNGFVLKDITSIPERKLQTQIPSPKSRPDSPVKQRHDEWDQVIPTLANGRPKSEESLNNVDQTLQVLSDSNRIKFSGCILLFGDDTLTLCLSKTWKFRKEGIERLQLFISKSRDDPTNACACIYKILLILFDDSREQSLRSSINLFTSTLAYSKTNHASNSLVHQVGLLIPALLLKTADMNPRTSALATEAIYTTCDMYHENPSLLPLILLSDSSKPLASLGWKHTKCRLDIIQKLVSRYGVHKSAVVDGIFQTGWKKSVFQHVILGYNQVCDPVFGTL
jgi:hypothetical protein